jgi:4-amino-4-deoxy-L-arabinose transferase-like glycosyltransferase
MRHHVLRWLVPLALLNGLLFFALLPPWQHYDEPPHFEYAALIAYHGGIPTAQAVDVALRREIAASMYRHDFYPPGVVPDLFTEVPAQVGFGQTVHPPLYYALAALPIRLTRFLPIEVQLYAARGLSLFFYVFSIVAAWRIAVVATPEEPRVHVALPLLLLATPAYADLMTAVNNDVLVNFGAIATLLALAYLIRDGLRPLPLVLLGCALAVTVLAKRTGLVFLPIAALGLFWGWRRTPFRPREQGIIAAATVAAAAILGVASLQIGRSAEGALTLELRPWLQALDTTYLRLNLARWLNQAGALVALAERLPELTIVVFTNFWWSFGWGQIRLGATADWIMAGLVLSCMIGLALRAQQNRGHLEVWEQRWIWLLFGCVVLGWLSLAVRFGASLAAGQESSAYVPRGRYIFTMMLPHLWLLALGWQGLMPAAWRHRSLFILPAIFAAGTLAAWIVLFNYYWR